MTTLERAERLTRKHYTEWHHQENGPQHKSYAALVVDIAAELLAVQRETREACAKRVEHFFPYAATDGEQLACRQLQEAAAALRREAIRGETT